MMISATDIQIANSRLVRPDLWETCQQCGGYGWTGGTVYHPKIVKCNKCMGIGDIPKPNKSMPARVDT